MYTLFQIEIEERRVLVHADDVVVNVLWGIVEKDKPKDYEWSRYMDMFKKVKRVTSRYRYICRYIMC